MLASLAGIPLFNTIEIQLMITNTSAYVIVTFAYLLFGIATWYIFTVI